MRTTAPLSAAFSAVAPDASSASSAPLTAPGPLASWQQVHQLLRHYAPADRGLSLVELSGLTAYHYCVYQAFGQEQDMAPAQAISGQLLQLLRQQPRPADHLEALCTLAWLLRQPALPAPAEAPALLAAADLELQREALRLRARVDGTSRRRFFLILRYFGLRLPDAALRNYLEQLLAELPAAAPPAPEPLPLGLADGLAGEVLVLIRLYQAGVRRPAMLARIRQGIQQLLAVKREVDFLEQRYSVFPVTLQQPGQEAVFSNELSWRHGDIGHSLLLYEATELLRDAELTRIAELVGLNTLLRTTLQATDVRSAQLLQGAAGVAHLYRKLLQVSGRARYEQGYRFWLEQTQQWLRPEFLSPEVPGAPAGGLWQGLAGVGLVLLSAAAEQELSWDALLL